MLPEDRRNELDAIVQDMIRNKESDYNIRFVVDDFKKKYIPQQAAVAEKPKKDLLAKSADVVSKIFPGKKVGETFGTVIASTKARLEGRPEEAEMIEATAPKPLEVLGDVAGGALSVAGVKGVGTVGKFASRFLKSIGLGAGISGSKAISEGADAGDVAKSTIGGGIVGGALPVAGAGLRAIGGQIEQLPARFVNSALSRNKAQVLQDIAKDNVDDFTKYVINNKGIAKSASSHLVESKKAIEDLNEKIGSALSNSVTQTGKKITVGRNNILDEVAQLPEARGALLKRNDVKGIVERLAPQTKQLLLKESLTIEEANKLRQLLDRTLGDKAFLGSQLSSDKTVLKGFANTLRETVKSKAPEGTRGLFSELSNEIRFRDGLLERIARKQGNQVLSFGDFIGGGLGGIFGGGIPGAIAGVAARRAIESVPVKIGAAKAVNALTKIEPVIEGLTPAQQTAIMNAFAEIFSSDDEQERNQK